jgi:hypothetical protein
MYPFCSLLSIMGLYLQKLLGRNPYIFPACVQIWSKTKKPRIPTSPFAMDDNIHPWAPGCYECTCGWSKCKGSVSRSTYYRHQLRHVLLQHYPRRQMPARMSVEDTFEVIKIACTKPKYVSFIVLCILFVWWSTICIHNMYTYLFLCTFELN